MIDDATIKRVARERGIIVPEDPFTATCLTKEQFNELACAIEQLARAEQREADAIDYKLLGRNLTEIFAQLLHQFENNITPITAKDVTASVEGGFARYRSEAVFHAKIDTLVYRTIDAIRASGKENSNE